MKRVVGDFDGQDVHAGFRNNNNIGDNGGRLTIEETTGGLRMDEIWPVDHDHQNGVQQPHDQNHLDDPLMFYSDFPPLPDFPCMSSSSSSSSTPAPPVKPGACSSSASSSSSATSWAVLRGDAAAAAGDECMNNNNNDNSNPEAAAMSSTASMEIPHPPENDFNAGENGGGHIMMETFGYMDLLDQESNEFFDPACIFQSDPLEQDHQQDPLLDDLQLESFQEAEMENLMMMHGGEDGGGDGNNNNNIGGGCGELLLLEEQQQQQQQRQNDTAVEEDMAKVFLEWLRINRETVSADDLRNVRIKKATIESAARRLGGGKEGMKQLLKLILEWVQTNHLQKRRIKNAEAAAATAAANNFMGGSFQNPNSNFPWIQAPPQQSLYPPPGLGYIPGGGGGGGGGVSDAFAYADHYQLLDSSLSTAHQYGLPAHFNSFPDGNYAAPPPAPGFVAGYQYPAYGQYFQGGGENGLVRLDSSATKEARKKRMARQRRFSSHRHHHHGGHTHHNNNVNSGSDHLQHCAMAAAQPNPANWVYWPSAAGAGAGASSAAAASGFLAESPVPNNSSMQNQNYPPRMASERRQGWKTEKNLRFLLQKVLKQSDVGNLGRIVLPKKEAETHLPELDARDGISIAMEDIGTSRVWNMRYRYWPNNKSRMYLLENTGDFVRANGLQEGDFIVIYSDVKCGKYMIRGVKVRQQGPKPESKRPAKLQKSSHSTANGSSRHPEEDELKS